MPVKPVDLALPARLRTIPEAANAHLKFLACCNFALSGRGRPLLENSEAFSVVEATVMRKTWLALLLATLPVTAASAADMALKAPPPAPAPSNWTGFYAGLEAGWGWGSEQVTRTTASASFPLGFVEPTLDYNGALGGVYAGYNYQAGQWLAGIDGDVSALGVSGSGIFTSPINGNVAHPNTDVDWLATATGRLGYVANNWLVFAKGGWAWAGFSGSSMLDPPGAVVNSSSSSETRDGWIVGGGLEYAYSAHGSVKVEYDYVGFQTANFNATTITPAGVVTIEGRSATSSLNVLKGGFAYRF